MTNLPPGWPPPPVDPPPTPAERKAYISALMRANQWERGESSRVLARIWGLDHNTVTNNATACSHVIRAGLDQLDASELRAEVVNDLRYARKLARRAAKAGDPIGAGKLVVAAADKLVAVTGCGAPKRQQVEMRDVKDFCEEDGE